MNARYRLARIIGAGRNPGVRRWRIALKLWDSAGAYRYTWVGGLR